jgi:histidinol-phosphate aminotransferase
MKTSRSAIIIGKNSVRAGVGGLKPYVAGKTSDEVMKAYGLKEVVKLSSNENPLGTGSMALKAMAADLANASIYPHSSCSDLLGALGAFYGLDASYFIAGNGSDEIFLMLAGTFLRAGQGVLLSENTFSQYACSSLIFEGDVQFVPLKSHCIDLKGFLSEVNINTRLIFLCSPNNPTGAYIPHKQLISFLNKIPSRVLVVLDEAYAEYATAEDFPSSMSLLKKYSNLMVCRTFSKVYGLAGLRVGYCAANPVLIREMMKFRNFNPFNINRLGQAAAIAALKDNTFFKRTVNTNIRGKNMLYKGLDKLGVEYLPTQGNFICFRASHNGLSFAGKLCSLGVIIRALGSFGMPDWCRVTIGTVRQNRAFLTAMSAALKSS